MVVVLEHQVEPGTSWAEDKLYTLVFPGAGCKIAPALNI